MLFTELEEVCLQGRNAVKSGKWLENEVETIIMTQGVVDYKYVNQTDLFEDGITNHTTGVLRKNVPYENVYKEDAIVEFVLKSYARGASAMIECKCQKVAGTVREKLPFVMDNFRKVEYEYCLLVLEGDGMGDNARNYTISESKKISDAMNKTINVVRLNEVEGWVKWFLKVNNENINA